MGWRDGEMPDEENFAYLAAPWWYEFFTLPFTRNTPWNQIQGIPITRGLLFNWDNPFKRGVRRITYRIEP